MVRVLGYAAAPVFAAMAILTTLSGGETDMLCTSLHGGSPAGGMGVMFALTSLFHVGRWLRLIRRL